MPNEPINTKQSSRIVTVKNIKTLQRSYKMTNFKRLKTSKSDQIQICGLDTSCIVTKQNY